MTYNLGIHAYEYMYLFDLVIHVITYELCSLVNKSQYILSRLKHFTTRVANQPAGCYSV